MAIVILGGLFGSTVLNLIVLPVLYGHIAGSMKGESPGTAVPGLAESSGESRD